jgi:hypothetical protein
VSAFRIPSLHSSDPFSYEQSAPCWNRLLKLVALSPLFASAFWSAMAWWLLKEFYARARFPNAVALALAAFCLILCLGSYGFLHWQAANFRMTKTVAFCFSIVVGLVLTLQLTFTLFVLDTARSAFVVFMSFNLVSHQHSSACMGAHQGRCSKQSSHGYAF